MTHSLTHSLAHLRGRALLLGHVIDQRIDVAPVSFGVHYFRTEKHVVQVPVGSERVEIAVIAVKTAHLVVGSSEGPWASAIALPAGVSLLPRAMRATSTVQMFSGFSQTSSPSPNTLRMAW